MSHASGLAAAIRGATESETFDLAGQNTSTITTNITNAFESPLPISEMIRITFVTGAGKLARLKYDENAAKAVTSALRDLGFEEDRGSSCVKECAGSFKLQHDTGKNLKTVVVFPKIQEGLQGENGDEGISGSASSGPSSLLVKSSPKEMIALASKSVFENMLKSRCQTWSQKKGCVAAIGELKSLLESLDQKLLHGTPLTDSEQNFYDQVSATSLDEKLAFTKESMHNHVDEGKITAKEKKHLMEQVSERLATVKKEITEETEKNNQSKKIQKLKLVLEKVEERKEKLSGISPVSPPPLKAAAEILKLRTELIPLLELEEGSKGRLLSVKETQSLARKEEILEAIANLEEKSRGWFEDDEDFEERKDACLASWNSNQKGNGKKKTSTTTSVPSATSKANPWVTSSSSSSKPRGIFPKAASSSQKKKSSNGGGVFAAMMMDSDSD